MKNFPASEFLFSFSILAVLGLISTFDHQWPLKFNPRKPKVTASMEKKRNSAVVSLTFGISLDSLCLYFLLSFLQHFVNHRKSKNQNADEEKEWKQGKQESKVPMWETTDDSTVPTDKTTNHKEETRRIIVAVGSPLKWKEAELNGHFIFRVFPG